ncbi:hypothetical protein SCALM49S_08605 [Streptomyces californicus]
MSQYTLAPACLSGFTASLKSRFISRSASRRTRPASVLPNRASMTLFGWSGLRFTQNLSGVRASQVNRASEESCIRTAPPKPGFASGSGIWSAFMEYAMPLPLPSPPT